MAHADYRLESEVARHGTTIVYRAVDTRTGAAVALTVLRTEAIGESERKSGLLASLRATATLRHPNIAVIHEIDSEADVTFVAVELVEGTSLNQLLAGGTLRFDHALDHARQIAAALSAAHDIGIVHPDLRPANIMMTRDGQVKVVGFGYDAADDGTVYTSPEQRQGQAVDARANIYSFGAVLYEMLTGQQVSVDGAFAPLRSVRPDVPAVLGAIVGRCLSKHPKGRYANGTELKRDLDAVVGSVMRWAHN